MNCPKCGKVGTAATTFEHERAHVMCFECGSQWSGKAVGEQVSRKAERRAGRIDVRAARDVLLEDVVLGGAHDVAGSDPLLLRDGDVHGDEDGRGRVDGHGRADLVERYAFEHRLHIAE